MTIADAHCHFFSQRFFETLGRQRGDAAPDVDAMTSGIGLEPPGPPEQLADRWLAELDRYGVTRAALIASIPGDEGSVATAVRRHPARFVGFFMVDPTPGDAVARVDQALDQGLRTVCLFPAMHRYPLYDERVLAIADRLAARPGTALFVHCGALSVGVRKTLGLPSRFESRFGNPLDLQLVAQRVPTLPILLPHFGAGLFRETLMIADLCPNIHVDTSSSNGWTRYDPALTLRNVFAQALTVLGPERLLFGTDSSFFPRGWQHPVYAEQLTILGELGVDARDIARIMGGNFLRLFPI